MKLYGLIGKHIQHSFSPSYFADKFRKEGLQDVDYRLFPLSGITEFNKLIAKEPDLTGLNVTIPYKTLIIPFLDSISEEAKSVGAVNTIKFTKTKTIGFNTDVFGFTESLKAHIGKETGQSKALILGTGGASKAISYALGQLNIKHQHVSRNAAKGLLTYKNLNKSVLEKHLIIINTTPLGMTPNIDSYPDLPYNAIGKHHLLFDLVYNPKQTVFMKKGIEQGATVVNGLQMLHLQAEKSWEIWQEP